MEVTDNMFLECIECIERHVTTIHQTLVRLLLYEENTIIKIKIKKRKTYNAESAISDLITGI